MKKIAIFPILFLLVPFRALGQNENASSEVREKILLFSTYISMIENSIGTRAYRRIYFIDKEKRVDVLQNGTFSCAYFVSSLLYHFGLIGNLQISVEETAKDMKKNGWISQDKPRVGSVIIWSRSRKGHLHIGFYIGKNRAISMSSKLKCPVIHKVNYDKSRKIIEILWHPKLEPHLDI